MSTRLPLLTSALFLSGSLAAAAATGTITPRPKMDVDYVKQQLLQLGYDDVTNVQRRGGIFEVLASQEGKAVDLRIDGNTGRIFNLASGQAIMPKPDMTADYVRQQLTAQGYTDLSGVYRLGDVWRVAAMRDGEPVQLRVDAKTGIISTPANGALSIPTQAMMTNAFVRQQLLTQGYANISRVERVGGLFVVKARKDGEPVDLRVDANTGRISQLSG